MPLIIEFFLAAFSSLQYFSTCEREKVEMKPIHLLSLAPEGHYGTDGRQHLLSNCPGLATVDGLARAPTFP